MRLSQQTQTRLDRGLFGTGPAAPHGFAHQAIVNLNVGSHRMTSR
jgi:hypothetical protein